MELEPTSGSMGGAPTEEISGTKAPEADSFFFVRCPKEGAISRLLCRPILEVLISQKFMLKTVFYKFLGDSSLSRWIRPFWRHAVKARQLYKNISMLFLFPVTRDLLFTNI